MQRRTTEGEEGKKNERKQIKWREEKQKEKKKKTEKERGSEWKRRVDEDCCQD